jgi:hypothetical protein
MLRHHCPARIDAGRSDDRSLMNVLARPALTNLKLLQQAQEIAKDVGRPVAQDPGQGASSLQHHLTVSYRNLHSSQS